MFNVRVFRFENRFRLLGNRGPSDGVCVARKYIPMRVADTEDRESRRIVFLNK